MRIEQFSYLVEVARNQSFSIAAKKLHITQPSISLAITNLENELGMKLINRSRTGISLTKKGEDIVKKAQEILRTVEEIKNEANINNSKFSGKLSIGVIPSICMSLLPRTLNIFKNKYPGVDIEISEGGSDQIKESVKKGELDLGFIGIPIGSWAENEHLVFKKLFKGEIMACVGKQSSLSFNDEISLHEISKHPIVIFNSRYSTNKLVTNLLKNYGEIKTLFTSDNTESAKKVIAQGLAIGFYPDLSLKVDPYVKTGEIIPLSIKDIQTDVIFGWIYSERFPCSELAYEFATILNAQAKIH
jgi:DNA-binding transcriptional LysR family regulator